MLAYRDRGAGALQQSPPHQNEVNARVWERMRPQHLYTRGRLRSAERVLFERYRAELSGRVLELGCGGGRITGHLVPLAGSLTGVDVSGQMVACCQRRYAQAHFERRDIRDLSSFQTGSFESIVAGFSVIDVLDDPQRRRLLDELHRLLTRGGLVIFSSHNLACAPLVRGPLASFSWNPIRSLNRLVRLPRALRNHRRLACLEQVHPDYRILNDVAHDHSMLHYYISRDGQQHQLEQHRFELLECLDLDGAPVPAGADAFGCHELHYAARRVS